MVRSELAREMCEKGYQHAKQVFESLLEKKANERDPYICELLDEMIDDWKKACYNYLDLLGEVK